MDNINFDNSWKEISDALTGATIPFQYRTVLDHNGKAVSLDIDMDPGGGFEGGYEFTVLSAPVPIQFTSLAAPVDIDDSFRFALHDQKVLDRIGKFFGMEDVSLGYEEFDKNIVVKTNDPERATRIFSNAETRKTFQNLSDFSLQFEDGEEGTRSLELMIDRMVNDPVELKKIYSAYISVLDNLSLK